MVVLRTWRVGQGASSLKGVINCSLHMGWSGWPNGKILNQNTPAQRRSRDSHKRGPRLAALPERSATVTKQQHSLSDASMTGDYGISSSGITEWPRVIGERQGGGEAPKVSFAGHLRARASSRNDHAGTTSSERGRTTEREARRRALLERADLADSNRPAVVAACFCCGGSPPHSTHG